MSDVFSDSFHKIYVTEFLIYEVFIISSVQLAKQDPFLFQGSARTAKRLVSITNSTAIVWLCDSLHINKWIKSLFSSFEIVKSCFCTNAMNMNHWIYPLVCIQNNQMTWSKRRSFHVWSFNLVDYPKKQAFLHGYLIIKSYLQKSNDIFKQK